MDDICRVYQHRSHLTDDPWAYRHQLRHLLRLQDNRGSNRFYDYGHIGKPDSYDGVGITQLHPDAHDKQTVFEVHALSHSREHLFRIKTCCGRSDACRGTAAMQRRQLQHPHIFPLAILHQHRHLYRHMDRSENRKSQPNNNAHLRRLRRIAAIILKAQKSM